MIKGVTKNAKDRGSKRGVRGIKQKAAGASLCGSSRKELTLNRKGITKSCESRRETKHHPTKPI